MELFQGREVIVFFYSDAFQFFTAYTEELRRLAFKSHVLNGPNWYVQLN